MFSELFTWFHWSLPSCFRHFLWLLWHLKNGFLTSHLLHVGFYEYIFFRVFHVNSPPFAIRFQPLISCLLLLYSIYAVRFVESCRTLMSQPIFFSVPHGLMSSVDSITIRNFIECFAGQTIIDVMKINSCASECHSVRIT